MNQMTSEKYVKFFLLMTFSKFQHFNLVSKISQKPFKPLPCHKLQYLTVLEKCCMPSAYLQWRFHLGEHLWPMGLFIFLKTCGADQPVGTWFIAPGKTYS